MYGWYEEKSSGGEEDVVIVLHISLETGTGDFDVEVSNSSALMKVTD